MKNVGFIQAIVAFVPRASVRIAGSIGLGALVMVASAMAQDATSAQKDQNAAKGSNYDVHQSWDVGGHISNLKGSGSMYDTLVNLESGPRILGQTLEIHVQPGAKHALFDQLFEGSTGYGGDPNAFSNLSMSKGKLYDFKGLFRRDRQYFDYDLFDNPLIPAGVVVNGYTLPQVQHSPHLFNTVRRMTDLDLTLLPVSRISYRFAYNLNIMQGPTYSSIHQGTEALLLQNWRNSTDEWTGGVDWKPVRGTTFTYEERIVHYKGNTSDTLANIGLLRLADGTPVSIGFDNEAAPNCGNRQPAISDPTTNPPTANPTCNGYLKDVRIQPTRSIFPTEEFRLHTSSIKNLEMTGRILYTSGNSSMPSYYELFSGLESRTSSRQETFTGSARARRINTAADYGIVWQVAPRLTLSEQFDFLNWHQPGTSSLTEVLQTGTSMAVAPGTPQAPDTAVANNFLGQKTESNSLTAEWEAAGWAQISLGWNYRARSLGYVLGLATDALTGRDYTYDDHQNSALLNLALRPTTEWRINGAVETGWSDNVYVPIAPRQFQQYQVRTTYKPKEWALLSGAYNDQERRDSHVGLQAHSRSLGLTASATPNERYSFDVSYGFQNSYSVVNNCFGDIAGTQPVGARQAPAGVTCGNLPSGTTLLWLGNSYYEAPTQNGTVGMVLTPVKKFQTAFGYRVTSIDGHTQRMAVRAVPGTLQSKFQTPYANVGWKLKPSWAVHGDWNYYNYGEGGPVGPTAPRNFHNNMLTIGLHYEH